MKVSDAMSSICSCLHSCRLAHASEDELQRAVKQALDDASITSEREAKLPCGRIDFLVGSVGIELKIKGSNQEVMRQLSRYLEHLEGIVLVTTRSTHRMPLTLRDKPVRVVMVGDWC